MKGAAMPGLRLFVCAFVCLLVPLSFASAAFGITLGQIDDFQDGTTQGWNSGGANPNPPANAANAGPLGAGDHALSITGNGGFGPGSNLVAMNPQAGFGSSQWTGNYTAAGVGLLFTTLRNPSQVPLSIRIGLVGGTSTSEGRFVTTDAVVVPANSGWFTVDFPIGPADLTFSTSFTPGNPITDPAVALTQVIELRIVHSVAINYRGEPIDAELLVDNIVAVPEPGLVLQLACGIGVLGVARAIRRQRAA
jgi:hypothetical protein